MQIRQRDRVPIKITHVADGDGFNAQLLDGSERTFNNIRLFGIDAPELEQKYGEESRRYLIELTSSGRFIMEIVEEDRYQRLVAIVYKDGTDATNTLNYIMAREGWAYWYSDFDRQDRLGIKEADSRAYMEEKGVWQEPNLERPWDYKDRMKAEAAAEEQRLQAERRRLQAEKDAEQNRKRAEQEAARRTMRAAQEAERKRIRAEQEEQKQRATRILFDAIQHHSLAELESHIAAGANVNVNNSAGLTPLHSAANQGNVHLANALISAGADINAKRNDDWTSLHLAAYQAHPDVANVLISAGAYINAKTDTGQTPLHLAALSKQC